MKWLLVILATLVSYNARAATMTEGTTSGLHWISISGPIKFGDDEAFARIVESINQKNTADIAVFLSSEGGLVESGLHIGEIVFEKKFYTVVPPGERCVSICAAIWVSGQRRYAGRGAKIGFHSAYVNSNNKITPSPVANALIGAHYNKIGLEATTIGFLMSKEPQTVQWLDEYNARAFKIPYVVVANADDSGERAISVVGTRLPAGAGKALADTKKPDTPVLSPEEAASAQRLVRRFNIRFGDKGIVGVNESIDECYTTAAQKNKWDSAVYCAALDVLATIVEEKSAEIAGHNLDSRNNKKHVIDRTDTLAKNMSIDADLLRKRGGLVAFVAASKVDTTKDPRGLVKVSSATGPVMERRSAGIQRPSTKMPACNNVASPIRPFVRGLGVTVSDFLCGSS